MKEIISNSADSPEQRGQVPETGLPLQDHFHQALCASLVESLPQCIFRKDGSGRFTFANRQFCRSLRVSLSELVGKTDFDFYPADLAEKYQRDDRRVLANFQSLEMIEEHSTPDGQKRWVQVVKTPCWNGRGEVEGIQGIFWDVTERKQAEEALVKSEEKFAKIFQASPAAIGISSVKDSCFVEVNEAFEKLLGYNREESIGKSFYQLGACADPVQVEKLILDFHAHGRIRNRECRLQSRSGQVISALISAEMIRLADDPSALWIVTDITERKQLAAQALRSQRLESIGRLASGIAHDINNVLAPILMAVTYLREIYAGEGSHTLLATLEASAKRGADIIKQLLTFARGVDGPRVALQPRHLLVDMAKIARETFPKSIHVKCYHAPEVWPVEGDATQLHQVLLNLCINAHDAMPGGGLLALRAENIQLEEGAAPLHPEDRPGPYVLLTVEDTGVGIPEHMLDQILEPFFTTKETGRGTGLGLATALGIVRSHGGFMRVRSCVGKGSQFEVYLPAVLTPSPQVFAAPTQPPAPGKGELILLIEDEEAICQVARCVLETHGYQVLTAHNGLQALALYQQHREKVNLVITDMMMPVRDGNTTIRDLKKLNPKIKIISVSGVVNGPGQDAYPNDVSARLLKPFTGEQLLSVVKEVLFQPADS